MKADRHRLTRSNYDSASQSEDQKRMGFSYIYILQSLTDDERFYTGLTDDLKDRLRRHNAGEVSHTTKHRPWRIKTAVAFADRERVAAFEGYLKTASGRAFAKKRL
jgi:putative endonuclease